MAKTEFEIAIEQATGKTVEELREMPVGEHRKEIEKKHGRPMAVTGGGTMVLTHQQVLKTLDKAIR